LEEEFDLKLQAMNSELKEKVEKVKVVEDIYKGLGYNW